MCKHTSHADYPASLNGIMHYAIENKPKIFYISCLSRFLHISYAHYLAENRAEISNEIENLTYSTDILYMYEIQVVIHKSV